MLRHGKYDYRKPSESSGNIFEKRVEQFVEKIFETETFIYRKKGDSSDKNHEKEDDDQASA